MREGVEKSGPGHPRPRVIVLNLYCSIPNKQCANFEILSPCNTLCMYVM